MTETSDRNENVTVVRANGQRPDPVRRGTHRGVAIACVSAFVGMIGMSYAAVPLYRLFCQTTGFAGTPIRAETGASTVLDRVIRVRFDANVVPGMPWTFEPVLRTVDVKVGETMLVFFKATNNGTATVKGSASFNVAPDQAGPFFTKIECFCFKEQTLHAGESVEMPVSFFIDPKLAESREDDGLKDITLSYTFYPVDDGAGKAAAVQPAGETGKGS